MFKECNAFYKLVTTESSNPPRAYNGESFRANDSIKKIKTDVLLFPMNKIL